MRRTMGLFMLVGFVVSAGLIYPSQSDSHLAYPFEEIPKSRAPLLPRITSLSSWSPSPRSFFSATTSVSD